MMLSGALVRCTATKANGGPCGAPATNDDRTLCIAHDPARAELQAAGRSLGASRGRKPRLYEVLHAKAEARAEQIVGTYFDALEAEKVIVSGGESVEITREPDHVVRMTASDRIMDRVLGKPTAAVEISGELGIAAWLGSSARDVV
jgi:hypothetical protein